MNVKEVMEIIDYLKKKKKKALDERNMWTACLEKPHVDPEEERAFEKSASEAGMEASLVEHFIRIMESIEVTR